jgi:hypothetical protein
LASADQPLNAEWTTPKPRDVIDTLNFCWATPMPVATYPHRAGPINARLAQAIMILGWRGGMVVKRDEQGDWLV